MSESLLKEYKEFSQKAADLQQQYRALVTEIIPTKELESRSLVSLKEEISLLPTDNPVYLTTGKAFFPTSVSSTAAMVENSLAASARSSAAIAERKKFIENSLREAETKNEFYLKQLESFRKGREI